MRNLKDVLKGKTVLITGMSKGIGKAICERVSDCDATIVGVARSGEALEELKKSLTDKPARIVTYSLDLRDVEARNLLLAWLKENELLPDILIHNAGKSIMRPLFDALDRFHDYERTMYLNYFAPVHLSLEMISHLKKVKGQMINVSAVNVRLVPAPKWTAYQASKSAFDQWFRSAESELRAKGIDCSSIYLPLVRTDMIKPTKAYDKMPAMHPDHVARVICRKMVTRGSMYRPWWLIFGEIGSVLFGKMSRRIMTRRMRKE